MAFFVGLFVAFMPIPGQTIAAAVLAVLLRCNLPLSVGLVFVTNPDYHRPSVFHGLQNWRVDYRCSAAEC